MFVDDDDPSSGGGSRRASAWHGPDAYAFGIICWQMLTLQRPWRKMSREAMWSSVRKGQRPPVTAEDEAAAPPGYTALMRELWAHDPVERPTFAEALRRLRALDVPTMAPPSAPASSGAAVADDERREPTLTVAGHQQRDAQRQPRRKRKQGRRRRRQASP